MKEILVTIALLILGIIIARMILSPDGLLGAASGLFQRQLVFLAE